MKNIETLDLQIAERLGSPEQYSESSTISIASGGIEGIAWKIGEETAELFQAVVAQTDEDVLDEAQTVLYVSAIGLIYRDRQYGLSQAIELAQTAGQLQAVNRNEVVKSLGRSAANFNYALAFEGSQLLVAGADLVRSVDASVRFRQLSLSEVIERI